MRSDRDGDSSIAHVMDAEIAWLCLRLGLVKTCKNDSQRNLRMNSSLRLHSRALLEYSVMHPRRTAKTRLLYSPQTTCY